VYEKSYTFLHTKSLKNDLMFNMFIYNYINYKLTVKNLTNFPFYSIIREISVQRCKNVFILLIIQ
jgi:hypothetical protein